MTGRDGGKSKERLCKLKGGGESVPFEAVVNLMMDLRRDVFLAPEPRKLLVELWRACREGGPDLPDGYVKTLLKRYLNDEGRVVAFVRQVVLAAAVWKNDEFALSTPFRRERDQLDYMARLPAGTVGDGGLRDVENDLLWDAEKRDQEEGRLVRLTSGVEVGWNAAKTTMFHLDYLLNDPDDPDRELSVATVMTLWRYCRGEGVGEENAAGFRGAGLADEDGPKPVVKAVVHAAVRFREAELKLVSPFSLGVDQHDYVCEYRSTGVVLSRPAHEGSPLQDEPSGWARRVGDRRDDFPRSP
jgi:hypothetical protein